MPINLPVIKEDQTGAAAPQAGRLEAPALNTTQPLDQEQNALDSAGKDVIKYTNQVAYQEADNTATAADNEFQTWHKQMLYGNPSDPNAPKGLIYQEGDPKQLYDDFNKAAQQKLNELSAAPDGQTWSDQTQNIVNRRLNKRANELYDESLTQYGGQKAKYDTTTAQTNSDLAAKALPLLSAQVDPDHPETFGPIQSKIDDIKQPLIAHALQYGGAIQTEDGQTILTPAVQAQVSKAVSDGLSKTIENLYHSDQGDGVSIGKAQALKAQFADQIDPFSKANLTDKGNEAILKQKSLALSNVINTKGANDPEVLNAPLDIRQQAMKMSNDYQREMEQISDRKQKGNYQIAAKQVLAQQSSGQPWASVTQMMNDPVVKRTYNNMNPAQQQALQSMVVAPKNTSPDAQVKWDNLLSGHDPDGNSLRGMPSDVLATYMTNMNKTSQNGAQAQWKALNSSTGPQQEQQYKNIATEFMTQAVGSGLVKKNQYGGNNIQPSDQQRFAAMKTELLGTLPTDGSVMSTKERQDYVAKFIAAKQTSQAFAPPARPSFNGSSSQTPTTPSVPNSGASVQPGTPSAPPITSAAQAYQALPKPVVATWTAQYKKDYGVAPTAQNLMDYIAKQKKLGN